FYKIILEELEAIYNYIIKNLKKKFIIFNTVLFISFILIIKKSREKLYLYINYQKLNTLIYKNLYFIFLINKIIDRLQNIKIFIKFNIY
ncbi:hypothetical protein BO79DRAFT_161765, partial [Aspergillus costaricaensis CBS 115574]